MEDKKSPLDKIREIMDEAMHNLDNPHLLADKLVETSSYLYYVGEVYSHKRVEWSKEFLKAKQSKNPSSGKNNTDKEAECIANEKVPHKDYLKTMLDIIMEFIKNTKVKVAVLNREKEYPTQ